MTYCESIGLQVGDKIRVLQDNRQFDAGSVITLDEDHDTVSPWFVCKETGERHVFTLVENIPCGYFPEGQGWERVSDEGWIEWYGIECPVPIGTKVDVKHRDGGVHKSQRAGVAGSHAEDWRCKGVGGSIVAYRLSPIRETENRTDISEVFDKAKNELKELSDKEFFEMAERMGMTPSQTKTTVEKLKHTLKKKRKHEKKSKKHLEQVAQLTTRSQELLDQLGKEIGVKLRFVDTMNSDEVVDTSLIDNEIPKGVKIDDPTTWVNGDIIKCIEAPFDIDDNFVTEGNHYTFIELDAWEDPVIEENDEGYLTAPTDVRYEFVRRP